MKRIILLSSVLCFAPFIHADYMVKVPIEKVNGGYLPNGSLVFVNKPDVDDGSDGNTPPDDNDSPTVKSVCQPIDDENYYFEMLDSNSNILFVEAYYENRQITDLSLVGKGEFGDEFLTSKGTTPFVYQICYFPNVTEPASDSWKRISSSYGAPTLSNCGYDLALDSIALGVETRIPQVCQHYDQLRQGREQNTTSYVVRNFGEPVMLSVDSPNTSGEALLTNCSYNATNHWDVYNNRVEVYTGSTQPSASQSVSSFNQGNNLWLDFLNQPKLNNNYVGRGKLMSSGSGFAKYAICYMEQE